MKVFKNYDVDVVFNSGLSKRIKNVITVKETGCTIEIFYYVVGDEVGKLSLCGQQVLQIKRVSM